MATQPTDLDVATDSEWDTSLPDPWLSTAFASRLGTVVYVRDDVPVTVRERLDATATELGVELKYVRRSDDTDLLARYGVSKARLLIYFSPKDVEYAVGWDHFKPAIETKKVRQRNNLSGRVNDTLIKDLSGWAGKTSLVKFAAGLGVPMLNKSSMDEFKANMWRGLTERPEEFLRYAVDDATVLLRVQQSFVDLINVVQEECLGMGDDLWTADDIPMTVGSLVAKTFERWVYTQAGEYKDALRFCIRKLGILDPDHHFYKRSRWAFWQAAKNYKSIDSINAGLAAGNDDIKHFMAGKFMFSALDGCGIKWWSSRPATESCLFNALVQGGRCLNENPYEYSVERGLDVDISGCYGESLRSLTYPVGLPTVWSYAPNEERTTFGAWLDRWEDELVEGLWTATVSGRLGYEQDLIFSKLATARDIHRPESEDDDTHSDLVMLRQQIVNGVITSDVLRTLRKVCSNAEWAGIRGLELATAVAYLRCNRKSDVREWCESVLQGSGTYSSWRGNTTDRRTSAWYGIPLEDFVGQLVDRRRHYKKLGKDASIGEAERAKAAGLDTTLKLIVNTLYGVFASRHFAAGNTVLANTITGRARVGVWMVAKALGLRQCITDGGIYTPGTVCIWNGYRPGLDTLSRQWDWHDPRRGRKHVPMGGRQWDGDTPPDVDELAMSHVREFWTPYGLQLQFKLEHKLTNSFKAGAYWSKGDYGLLTEKGTVYALRGKDRIKRDGVKRHPTFALMDSINAGSDEFPTDLTYNRGGILKLGKYNIIQASNGYEDYKNLRPGDGLPVQEFAARYNNTHMPMKDEAEYLRRRNRKKTHRGKPVQWFERYGPKGISGVHRGMKMDTLRLAKAC